MLLKMARERSVRLSAKNTIPRISAPQWTAARSEKNLPTPLKNWSMLLESDAEASTPITSDQAYALHPGGAAISSELVVEVPVELFEVFVLVDLILVDVVESEIVLAVEVVLVLVLVGRAKPLAGRARCENRSLGCRKQSLGVGYLIQQSDGRHRVPFRV